MSNDYLELRSKFSSLGVKTLFDESMSKHTTFQIGGPAKIMIFPDNGEQLIEVVSASYNSGIKYIVIGNGSDLLFDDRGYDGVVISTKHIRYIEAVDSDHLNVSCGVSCNAMAKFAASQGLAGLEFAYGIPGSCGGAVFMNAGAYGSEMSSVVEHVECYGIANSKKLCLSVEELKMSYRHSLFMLRPELVILSATFKLCPGNKDDIYALMQSNMNARRAKQPLEYPNAGSVFKRQDNYIIAKMIDECGLKGYTIGGAQVSEKHAGFIVNRGNASSEDVLALMSHIKNIILTKYGFEPECEIRYIR